MRRALLLLALLVVAGCASVPGGPAATIGKVRAWWSAICSTGDETLAVAQHAAEATTADAGVNETGVPVNDTGHNVNSSGGEADASRAANDASPPADASAPETSTAGGLE